VAVVGVTLRTTMDDSSGSNMVGMKTICIFWICMFELKVRKPK
jgi:hypothetical protein